MPPPYVDIENLDLIVLADLVTGLLFLLFLSENHLLGFIGNPRFSLLKFTDFCFVLCVSFLGLLRISLALSFLVS